MLFVPDQSFLSKVVSDSQGLDFLWFSTPLCALSDYYLQIANIRMSTARTTVHVSVCALSMFTSVYISLQTLESFLN